MEKYKFNLYIVNSNPSSFELVNKIKSIFNETLKDNYVLEIIDVLENPQLVADDNVIASPTLIMKLPGPEKRTVGGIFNKDSLLQAFDILEKSESG